MTANDLRQKYINFFIKKGHKEIHSASLIPENDPTTLFNSSGMQSLVPYLLGQTHPEGQRICNSQPCFRTQDIEEIGDNRHTTFFEMLGNWSLGDYFKKEQLTWFWEFLTKEINLDPNKLYVSVFKGNNQIQKDDTSENIWKDLGVPEDHIFYFGEEKNWWSRSGTPEKMPTDEIGGPDSEVFYEFTQVKHDKKYGEKCHPNCDCGRFMEIGNSVFIQYQKQSDGSLRELSNKNVDFGGGLERLTAASLNEPDIFKTDLFLPIIERIVKITGKNYLDNAKEMRVIADHLKAATFLISNGICPSNKTQGYFLRRLLRRSAVKLYQLTDNLKFLNEITTICDSVIAVYDGLYGLNVDDLTKKNGIYEVIKDELNKFGITLDKGLKEFNKYNVQNLHGLFAFNLYQTYGFPLELTIELIEQKGGKFNEKDIREFNEAKKIHSEMSRKLSSGMFKGGLADSGEETTKLHTATHLLHQALRIILGTHVGQKGSNITSERLRFDFSHQQKMTPDEIDKVEQLVNEKIKENLPITYEIMDIGKAQENGALAFFAQKYGENVKVYSIGNFSKEVCGGPHVDFTGKLKSFKIIKEESAGSGIRRIYAKVGG